MSAIKLILVILYLYLSKTESSSRQISLSKNTNEQQPIPDSAVNKSQLPKGNADVGMMIAEGELEFICPSNVECNKLGGECIVCKFNHSCVYGQPTTVECEAGKPINCSGDRVFNKTITCRYCYQTETWEHKCLPYFGCRVVSSPRERELTNCTVRSDVVCLGKRRFRKNPLCNWTDGYKWSTALVLSITLGGFGADRFYLGHWQEGIGKLFSFGGLGIWTLLDVILISVGYLSPADGSLYI